MTFDPQYIDHVLSENFEDAKALFLSPLMAVHYAHLVMLADRGIVSAADARTLRDALDSISVSDVRATPYDERCEDLFFYVERLLVQACGEETAGRLHTARSRNDIDMTMYRLRQREFILALVDASLDLREGLIGLAERHRETLLAALGRLSLTTKVRQRTVTVLAIDDDPAALALYRGALAPEGFVVREAASGEDGLVQARSEPVDLIVLDLLLPDLDGFEVAARLKTDPSTADIPILVITGHEFSDGQKERLNGQVLAVLTKGDEALRGLSAWLGRLSRQRVT